MSWETPHSQENRTVGHPACAKHSAEGKWRWQGPMSALEACAIQLVGDGEEPKQVCVTWTAKPTF